MYTPHPSYPPYDAACSGSVVLTNQCFNKTEMSECNNIILGDLTDFESFMRSFEKAVKLSEDIAARTANYKNSQIPRSWDAVLADIIDFMNTAEPIGK